MGNLYFSSTILEAMLDWPKVQLTVKRAMKSFNHACPSGKLRMTSASPAGTSALAPDYRTRFLPRPDTTLVCFWIAFLRGLPFSLVNECFTSVANIKKTARRYDGDKPQSNYALEDEQIHRIQIAELGLAWYSVACSTELIINHITTSIPGATTGNSNKKLGKKRIKVLQVNSG